MKNVSLICITASLITIAILIHYQHKAIKEIERSLESLKIEQRFEKLDIEFNGGNLNINDKMID